MVNETLLKNCKIIGDNSISDLTDILIDDGRIVGIGHFDCMDSCEYHDLNGNYVSAGFIDIHTHGAYGFDTNDGAPEGLRDWMRRIPEEGVTAVLPTTVTQMPDVLERAERNTFSASGTARINGKSLCLDEKPVENRVDSRA